MEFIIWALTLYGRYVATVLIVGASVVLALWLASSIVNWSNRRPSSTKEPSG
jgi:hypothetical protein